MVGNWVVLLAALRAALSVELTVGSREHQRADWMAAMKACLEVVQTVAR